MEANFDNASFEDIIFEGRNKAYGAYLLRREYHTNLKKATALAISGFALLFGFSYAAIKLKPELVESKIREVKSTTIDLQIKPEFEQVQIKQAILAQPVTAPKIASSTFTEPKIVPSDEIITEDIPEQAVFANADPGEITSVGELPGKVAPPLEEGSTENGAGTGTATSTEPFLFVEEMPSFSQGGEAGMYKYISKHLHYPQRAQEQGLEGNVIVSFVVSISGEISDVKVLKDIGGGTAEEAVRVISKMPRWKPGIQNHRPVPVRMTLPIRFKLSS